MNSITQWTVIVLTSLSTITTFWIYSARNSIERTLAVNTTLIALTVVLGIEIFYHFYKPRESEYTIMGGALTEWILIILLVLYEWIPTLYRLDRYEGQEQYMRREIIVLKLFSFVGVITAVLTLLFGGFFLFGKWSQLAETINAYGLLFIIPTLGVGEFIIMRYGIGIGFLACIILCAPILYIVYMYLDQLTAITYFTTAAAFFSDELIGCRRFLKYRYELEQMNQDAENSSGSDVDL